jgi:hypothetical protein
LFRSPCGKILEPIVGVPHQSSEFLQTSRIAMTAIARMISLAFPTSSTETEILKVIAMVCGVGLVVSLVVASYGVDLSTPF